MRPDLAPEEMAIYLYNMMKAQIEGPRKEEMARSCCTVAINLYLYNHEEVSYWEQVKIALGKLE